MTKHSHLNDDPKLLSIARGLDSLAEHDAASMPEGLAGRILRETTAPARALRITVFQRLALPLAAAAALAFFAVPIFLSNRTTTPPVHQASYEADALELFELATSSLASTIGDDIDALTEDAASFDPAIDHDTSWLDESESI